MTRKFTHPDQIDNNHLGYETSKGLPVRIYATDAGGKYPIHGAIRADDKWIMNAWTADGKNLYQSSLDLFDKPAPPVKREAWVNCYRNMLGSLFPTKEAADAVDMSIDLERTACLHITWFDGEGLE